MANEKDSHNLFNDLVKHHRNLIRKICWRHSQGDEDLCEELIQECYLAIWQHLDTLHPEVTVVQVKAWVVWQCRNVFSHHERHKKREIATIDERQCKDIPSEDIEKASSLLDELSQTLTDDERRLLALMRQDLTNLEIAEKLGLKSRTVRDKQRHIINKLKRHYINKSI